VPKLYDLFFVIEAGFQTRDQRRTTAEVEQMMTPALKIRLTLIRMITAHHFLNRLPGDSASQWELIDDQLSQIRTWTGHRKQAFAAMLKRRDQELFTGKAMIEDIDPQMVRLPSDEEVENYRLSMAGETEGEDPLIVDHADVM
jgi:recombinational DNA repair ATPase RecF